MREVCGDDQRLEGFLCQAFQTNMEKWINQLEDADLSRSTAQAIEEVCVLGRESIERSVAEVAQRSESPCERLFVGSLLAAAWAQRPLGLFLLSPRDDAARQIDALVKESSMYRELELKMRANGEEPIRAVREFAECQLREGRVSSEGAEMFSERYVLMRVTGLERALWAIMQAPFPQIRVQGRSIRADLAVFVPAAHGLKVIVECDGFDYHSHKDAFERDRQRDRVLRREGYEDLRYSGTEIYRDPIQAAQDLLDHLSGLRDAQVLPEPFSDG